MQHGGELTNLIVTNTEARARPDKMPTIIQLPQLDRDSVPGEEQEALIDRYQRFRLDALKNDPEVFASSYAEENNQPRDYWRKRLANPSAVNLVAVMPSGDIAATWKSGDKWCGMIVLLGPMAEHAKETHASQSPWSKVPSVAFNQSSNQTTTAQGAPAPQNLTYHISGAYTAAQYRGQGCGKALMRASVEQAKTDCTRRGGQSFTIGVHVDTFNNAARVLYKKFGFTVVSEEIYPPRPTEQGERKDRRAYLMQRTERVA
ncbi:hypothetical protein KVT40_006542 [Elsinoe batatas]|uniref:N-acetyltransferase domain-containing protein n=1 Tax=Elsinoe batatas TaxID=2601811 RepID=A0A8K0KXU8_9PEZI|nr:hypothetical protein KVT40_006542 [Elsinoe batatas]